MFTQSTRAPAGARIPFAQRSNRRAIAAAAATFLAFSMASCGGGGGGGGSGGGGSNPPPTATAPTISAQPQNATVNAGDSATFSVTASGTSPLSYQWMQGGKAISGATSSTYTIANATAQDSGAQFSAAVSNSAGSVTSSSATLTVVSPPTISAQPQNATVGDGNAVTFSVTATATAALSYQWLENGSPVSGATGSSYTISSTTLPDSGSTFTVKVSDSAGSTTSTAATLRVTGLEVLAGSLGGVGYADESNGNPLTARFLLPVALAVDPKSGNIFVLDSNVVREISNGQVTTLAGSPGLPAGDVEGAGTQATFAYPHALAIDPTGSELYVADSGNEVIRKVSTADGSVSLFAGTPAPSSFAPNTSCVPSSTNACFGLPNAVAVDSAGNVIVEDAYNQTQIYKFTPQGAFTTFAADTGSAFYPSALAFNPISTELLFADDSYVGYLPYPGATSVQSIAGSPGSFLGGTSDSAPGDTSGINARFGCETSGPAWTAEEFQFFSDYFADFFLQYTYGASGIALKPDGSLAYVADTCNDTIRAVQVPSGITSTLAGVAGSVGSADGSGRNARFDGPSSVATDSVGNVYVADTLNATIREITPGGTVTTVAGEPATYGSSNGSGTAARFDQPRGLAVDSQGNIFVADALNDTIRKITPSGVVSLYAGVPGKAGYQDGGASTALFNFPHAVAVDSSGNVYVADYGNDVIRKITSSGVVSTYAGVAPTVSSGIVSPQAGFVDGTPGTAMFSGPLALAVDSSGNLFVADYENCAIREITAATNSAPSTVATVAGKYAANSPTCANSSSPEEEGSGTAGANPAILGLTTGVAVDHAGNVYFGSITYVAQSNGSTESGATIDRLTDPGAAGSVVTFLVGSATVQGAHDGTGYNALFSDPLGMVVDAKGDLFVADQSNHAIRQVTFDGTNWIVKTVVGTLQDPTASSFNPRAPIGNQVGALPGSLNAPWGLGLVSPGAADGSGVTLAVSDQAENSVILVNVN
jgi:sugar lactone lactonase YvrE